MGLVPLGVQLPAPQAYGSVEKTFGERPEAMAKDLDPATPTALVAERTVLVMELVGRSQPSRVDWAWSIPFPKKRKKATAGKKALISNKLAHKLRFGRAATMNSTADSRHPVHRGAGLLHGLGKVSVGQTAVIEKGNVGLMYRQGLLFPPYSKAYTKSIFDILYPISRAKGADYFVTFNLRNCRSPLASTVKARRSVPSGAPV